MIAAVLLWSAFALSQAQSAAPQSASPPGSKTEDAAELVKQGEKLNADGKPDEALALFQRAMELDPELYQAQLFTGMALDLKGEYQEARKHLAKAVELASEQQTMQALRVMAVSYAFECNTAKASDYEQRAFDLQNNWKHYTDAAGTADELARIYLECGDADNAFHWYQVGNQAAMRAPDLTPAQKDLWDFRWEAAQARIAGRRGQREQAQQHLAALKTIIDKGDNPDQAPFYPQIVGYVAFYTGDYSTAIKQLQQANQKDPFVLCLLAQTYGKLGDKAHARLYYEQIMTINAHSPANAFARTKAKQQLAELAPAAATSQAK